MKRWSSRKKKRIMIVEEETRENADATLDTLRITTARFANNDDFHIITVIFTIPLPPGMGVIFKLTCTVTGKMYIGQTRRTVRERLRNHVHKSKDPKGHRLYQAMHENDFLVEIIELCKVDELNESEKFWIAHHKTLDPECGFNQTSGENHHMRM